jgi:hypothetical protein
MRELGDIRRAIANTIEALARVHSNDQRRRDSLAQLRYKYDRLEPLKRAMSKEDVERLEQIGELIRALEQLARRTW